MLQKTYQRIVGTFKKHNGYMTFSDMLANGITVLQMRELEESGTLERFARGCYWCKDCGIEKPKNHKYVEIGIANPDAVICLESASFLNELSEEEPEVIHVATERTDRKKMEFAFDVQRYYFQNAGIKGEIKVEKTKFGTFKYYSKERTICDILRMKNKVSEETLEMAVNHYKTDDKLQESVKTYAKKLRAYRNVICYSDEMVE